MAHVYYGDPREEFSLRLIRILAESGADIIELGIPFSDPIADGPTFQAACERALKGGITPTKCIDGIRRLREEGLETPIVVTTYFNIPYAMGFEKFLEEIKNAGAHGILVPDLPAEEAKPFLKLARRMGLHLILHVAPTTSQERLKGILAEASGFVYLISIEGVTGARFKGRKECSAMELIKAVKAQSPIPIMVGFGISVREHAEAMVSAGADGVVVGSAYARIYQKSLDNPYRKIDEIARLAREIKLGCIEGYRNRC
ncbi:tryptophan synthase subunit alpha [Candidatus Bathyarchaeota archaeon]|nr:tryptophan synthase subunit alpha [Candidatus Bathyarchaeota archaeon]